ncbi:MAG TPA: hypothetical protein VKE70_01875 [Candidatus Solibacter sp.]|nr:hypothetical protein [Candidatus Solibacter sp.]
MRRRRPQGENDPSPDINFSRVSVSGTAAGLLVTLVILGIGLAGLPPTRWLLVGSIPLGLIVALILHFTARDR